jgi:prepilin signal peptidase PulO-like enzyme (type II secretory pathway)
MWYLILFVFGLAIGSFLNVLALRYDGDHFVLDPGVIGGRSYCPHCKRTLRWFELIPLVSFLAQGGTCRRCGARISWQYPAVEFLSACVFALVPWHFSGYVWLIPAGAYMIPGLWILALEILLLITCIDLRLYIIPDELTAFLGVVAIFETIFAGAYLAVGQQSFLGSYAVLFGSGIYGNLWLSHIAGGIFGILFFGALALVTRGKGMGMGDVKLALPLGFLFGWPDIIAVCGAAFVIGALVGVILMARGQKSMKSAVPFAPFLALGAAAVFFFGAPVLQWYFHIIGA